MNTIGKAGIVTGALLMLAEVSPSVAVDYWLFPSDQEMRQTVGYRTERYEFPPRNVMKRVNGYRKSPCTPRYARRALSVGSWSYNLMNAPHGGQVTVTVWKYSNASIASNAVDTYRQQMAGCKRYRLYSKNGPSKIGFPMRTSAVNGGPGEARMRHKYGDVVDSAVREWLTAVDRYIVQVEATYWGSPRPPFPPARMPRSVTDLMTARVLATG